MLMISLPDNADANDDDGDEGDDSADDTNDESVHLVRLSLATDGRPGLTAQRRLGGGGGPQLEVTSSDDVRLRGGGDAFRQELKLGRRRRRSALATQLVLGQLRQKLAGKNVGSSASENSNINKRSILKIGLS